MVEIMNNINYEDVKIKSKRYYYSDRVVPRVTEILSAMLHEEGIVQWSNSLGFSNKSYSKTLNEYAQIGTYTHESIENILKFGFYINEFPRHLESSINNAIRSFSEWFKIIREKTQYEILGIEDVLSCEYFGGTADLLIRINGKVYLVDFKTSNYITYKHFVQLSAYRHMYSLSGIEIDGVMILQLSKKNIEFKEYLLDFSNTNDLEYIDECFKLFMGITMSYYQRTKIEDCKTFRRGKI